MHELLRQQVELFLGNVDALPDNWRAFVDAVDRAYTSLNPTPSETSAPEPRAVVDARQLQLLYDNAPLPYQSLDADGSILEVNKAWSKTLGYSRAEAIGRWFGEFLTPECRAKFKERFPQFKAAGEVAGVEFELVRKCGSRLLASFDGKIAYSESGEFERTHCIMSDITERKRADAALRQSEERYRQLFDNANEAIFVAQDTYVRFFNPKLMEFTGLSREELIGKSIEGWLHPEDREMVVDRHLRRLRGEDPPQNYDFRIVLPNGDVKWLQVNAVRIIWDGKPATLNFTSDITWRRQAEKERLTLERQLQQSHKMEAIGTLAGGIAHDFNNILSGILGFTELTLLDMTPGTEAYGNLTEIVKVSKRAKDLIQQINSFSRIDTGGKRRLRLAAVVADALGLIRGAVSSNITINQEATGAGNWTVEADPTQIHQLIMNVCGNAVDMMPEGGILEVKIAEVTVVDGSNGDGSYAAGLEPGAYVKLSIIDTGCGMSKEVQERAFEPYFTTKETGKGTGMGLAVVHGIVKSHGGRIMMNSFPGAGTCVEIYLPALDVPEEAQPEEDSQLADGNESILFVDDEEVITNLQERQLSRWGYRVTAFKNSMQALEFFRAHPENFDLVITDLTMPQMTGTALSQQIHEINPQVPIILCTGFNNSIDQAQADALGIAAVLLKPTPSAEFAQVIRGVLNNVERVPRSA